MCSHDVLRVVEYDPQLRFAVSETKEQKINEK